MSFQDNKAFPAKPLMCWSTFTHCDCKIHHAVATPRAAPLQHVRQTIHCAQYFSVILLARQLLLCDMAYIGEYADGEVLTVQCT